MGKRYKKKDCAYCGRTECSSTNDHVIPRSFFPDAERGLSLKIPQVPACFACNNEKSALEAYVGSTLLIASKHPEAERYRKEKVGPRLRQNRKLWNQLGIEKAPQMVFFDGIWQPMHVVTVDNTKISSLLRMIVQGLYFFHFGTPLPKGIIPDVTMIKPENEAIMWLGLSEYFPANAQRVTHNLGSGSFIYTYVQSPIYDGFTVWSLGFHGNIRLYGKDGFADHWWCFTRPSPEMVAAVAKESGGASV